MDRKPIFDSVRRLLGRGFRKSEIAALDAAIERAQAGTGSLPQEPVTRVSRPRREVSARGIELIRQFEGLARVRDDGLVEAYPDPGTGGAPWTIGWGATGTDIGPETTWTRAECDARLARDVARNAGEVIAALGDAPTTQAQFDAMVSFHFNTGAIARATLTRLHRSGDFAGAAVEFARWNRASGRVLPGLVRRRAAEARLYSS